MKFKKKGPPSFGKGTGRPKVKLTETYMTRLPDPPQRIKTPVAALVSVGLSGVFFIGVKISLFCPLRFGTPGVVKGSVNTARPGRIYAPRPVPSNLRMTIQPMR